jgi:hypothetical protein
VKKKNLEREVLGIHNPPERFYYKFKHITLLAEGLSSIPTVTTHRVLRASTVNKVYDWEKRNNLQKTTAFEWVELIKPLVHIFDLTEKLRKQLFSEYLETHEAKLVEAIEATKRAIDQVYNDEVRLIGQYNQLNVQLQLYEDTLKQFKDKHKRTGKYKLLYDALNPLVNKFESEGITHYRQERLLAELFEIFEFDDFEKKSDPIQSTRRILKEVRRDITS